MAGQQVVEHAAERVHVSARVYRATHHLLWRDVVGHAHEHPGPRQPAA